MLGMRGTVLCAGEHDGMGRLRNECLHVCWWPEVAETGLWLSGWSRRCGSISSLRLRSITWSLSTAWNSCPFPRGYFGSQVRRRQGHVNVEEQEPVGSLTSPCSQH